ncbi:DNA-formamidopyrimidine glycosylase family protein [Mucilaginibacter phyllosphaerae]|uniref:Formamidopyrimidine-DNA glycosylase n=1 Tax=Mucilaginibacter phyllosphaerae TaxID=1812349 RepID=A0A4Y8AKB5_9SPHI|nr:DNA-formamidopyrimidine glycosylase family protein [Mucilaginibacter phyllosphaerae]MBB3967876.1 formamidopyrimidine-DNA glycosylase [Mucilaginibacter phyllosphaerae]TEW69082.1 Fpg/Nei family DNA glycosylase [Mucilaginibacter phyllosphaerae]GGH02716.1 formamidopyrimidine-DNA glycosylase [Mucilaginibacter phyllosphaerae]
MPELPDLQVFSHNLDKKLSGKTVKQITVHKAPKLNVSHQQLQDTLQGQKLSLVYRDGKELFFKFGKGDVLGLHLMLHGKLFLFEGKSEQKYPIIEILFTDDTGLVLTDFQGIAAPMLNPEVKDAPDALSKDAGEAYLKSILAKKKTSIKAVLLDQKIIRGIGNAYADEILWDARISPFSAGNKIPADKVKDLVRSIHDVLKNAEKEIIKANPDIIAGEIRDFMLIHNAGKKQSPNGAPILIDEKSRKTYYTEEQELYS